MSEYLRGDELESFVKNVERLRKEGLKVQDILERLGVPRSTLISRLRRHREASEGQCRPIR